MFAYLARMCALEDAQFASPIAFGRGCSVRQCNDSLLARSLARPGGATYPGVSMVVSVCFDRDNNQQRSPALFR